MTAQDKTAFAYVPDRGTFELQATAAVIAASAELTGEIADTWLNFSGLVRIVNPGTPGQRNVTEDYTIGSTDPMTSRSSKTPRDTGAQLTLYSNNAQKEDAGGAANYNLFAILRDLRAANIIVPMRYSPSGGASGDRLLSYDMYVDAVPDPVVDATSQNKSTVTVPVTLENRAESTVA